VGDADRRVLPVLGNGGAAWVTWQTVCPSNETPVGSMFDQPGKVRSAILCRHGGPRPKKVFDRKLDLERNLGNFRDR
jgi:hypothetical protein